MSDVQALDLDRNEIRSAIQEEYSVVAEQPDRGFHFHTGRPLLTGLLGYEEAWLDGIADEAIDSAAGTGNPFSMGIAHADDNVVDVGCGAGIDSLIAGKMVGSAGHVVGVDMTPAMLARAKSAATSSGLDHVEFRSGFAEELPVSDAWADMVISNGVLNLFPDKAAGLREMARVLKPGGRLQIADILVEKAVPMSAKNNIDLWTGWIAGALLDAELQQEVIMAGFVDFEITWRKDVFDGAPQESSAANFGTTGINFRARKPIDAAEWEAALIGLTCELPQADVPTPLLDADWFCDVGDQEAMLVFALEAVRVAV